MKVILVLLFDDMAIGLGKRELFFYQELASTMVGFKSFGLYIFFDVLKLF